MICSNALAILSATDGFNVSLADSTSTGTRPGWPFLPAAIAAPSSRVPYRAIIRHMMSMASCSWADTGASGPVVGSTIVSPPGALLADVTVPLAAAAPGLAPRLAAEPSSAAPTAVGFCVGVGLVSPRHLHLQPLGTLCIGPATGLNHDPRT